MVQARPIICLSPLAASPRRGPPSTSLPPLPVDSLRASTPAWCYHRQLTRARGSVCPDRPAPGGFLSSDGRGCFRLEGRRSFLTGVCRVSAFHHRIIPRRTAVTSLEEARTAVFTAAEAMLGVIQSVFARTRHACRQTGERERGGGGESVPAALMTRASSRRLRTPKKGRQVCFNQHTCFIKDRWA